MKTLFQNAKIYQKGAENHVLCGYVAVDGAVITEVGEGTRDAAGFDRVIDCGGNLLLPGLYNAHSHSAMTIFRGYGEEMSLHRWLNERILPAEELLTDESVYYGSLVAAMEMVRGGTVSFSDMYFFCDATARAVREIGMKANLSRSIVSFDENIDMKTDSRMQEAARLFSDYHMTENGKLRIDMALHAEYSNKMRAVQYVSEYAKEHGANLQIHLSETAEEHAACIERHGKTPTEFFLEAGAFDVPVTAAHCVYLSESDMAILAAHGATAAHCPVSNLKLGSGVMPFEKLKAAGVSIGIGTDGAASNNTLDMFREMSFAALVHKGVGRDPEAAHAADIIEAATLAGARAQGRDDAGVIAAGYRADIVLLDLSSVNNIPMYDAAATVTYSASSRDVKLTMIDGTVVYENGTFRTVDEEKVLFEARRVFADYFKK